MINNQKKEEQMTLSPGPHLSWAGGVSLDSEGRGGAETYTGTLS